MEATVWLVGVVLIYIALNRFIVAIGIGLKKRDPRDILQVVGIVIACLLIVSLPHWEMMTKVLVASAGIAASLTVLIPRLRTGLTGQQQSAVREIRRQTTLHFVLLSASTVFLVPFVWLVTTSLKEDEDMSKFPPVWLPKQQVKTMLDGKEVGLAYASYQGQTLKVAVLKELETGERQLKVLEPAAMAGQVLMLSRTQVTKIKEFGPVWKNYPDALKFLPDETLKGLVFLGNTLWLSAFTIIGTLLSSSLVAFSFARLRWPGRDLLFVMLLATMMIPGAVTMMPLFLIFRSFGWIDSLRPLWVPAFFGGGAFNIFLLRQFFLTIPNDLEEAARIDGCSYFGIYWRIMLPLIKPALAAITIMTFMASWNNFMGPLIYVSSPTRMPLAYALQLYQTAHGNEPGLLMAASTMMMLPVLALFFFTQRYFIQGVTLTGIKG